MNTRSRIAAVLGAIGVVIAVACGVEWGWGEEKPGSQLTEHRPLIADRATKQIGEDCKVHGYTECLSQVCLHTLADPERGYFCSTACERESDCPAEFSCQQIHPNRGGRICIPPTNWSGAVAAARRAR